MRDVIDYVVEKKCREKDIDVNIYKERLEYQGKVSTKQRKVTLESKEFGIEGLKGREGLEWHYRMKKIDDDKCVIRVEGRREVEITKDQAKMIKALALESINACKEYSETMSYVFMRLVVKLMQGDTNYVFQRQSGTTMFQDTLLGMIEEFIQKELNGTVDKKMSVMEGELL